MLVVDRTDVVRDFVKNLLVVERVEGPVTLLLLPVEVVGILFVGFELVVMVSRLSTS